MFLISFQTVTHIRPGHCCFWLLSEFPSIETPLCSCAPGSSFAKCDLSGLLSDAQCTLCIISLTDAETPRSGVFVTVELLEFHPKMKTTWPAVGGRWKSVGEVRRGQRPSVTSSFHFLSPFSLQTVAFNPVPR